MTDLCVTSLKVGFCIINLYMGRKVRVIQHVYDKLNPAKSTIKISTFGIPTESYLDMNKPDSCKLYKSLQVFT